MLHPQSISEELMYSTIRLSIGTSTATGFFYELNTPKKTVIVISNRHFAEQVDSLSKLDFSKNSITQQTQFLIHVDDGTNKQISENIEWFLHPSADLAFFVLEKALRNHPLPANVNYLVLRVNPNMIPTQTQLNALTALENVIMVGYPNGLYDSVNNYPLFRTGKTATHPAIDYNGKKKAILDMACLPGSSGSPVFVFDEGWIHHKNGGMSAGSRIFFLGIENSMPTRYSKSVYKKTILPDGKISYNQTDEYIVEEDMNLGYYIKSSEISGFNAQIQSLSI
jgi:hypothetical protein